MKTFKEQNFKEKEELDKQKMESFKTEMALRFHYLRSTKSIAGVYNKKIISKDLQEENPTIDGQPVDSFLKSTFKVCFFGL